MIESRAEFNLAAPRLTLPGGGVDVTRRVKAPRVKQTGRQIVTNDWDG